jgi:hypothetical protein
VSLYVDTKGSMWKRDPCPTVQPSGGSPEIVVSPADDTNNKAGFMGFTKDAKIFARIWSQMLNMKDDVSEEPLFANIISVVGDHKNKYMGPHRLYPTEDELLNMVGLSVSFCLNKMNTNQSTPNEAKMKETMIMYSSIIMSVLHLRLINAIEQDKQNCGKSPPEVIPDDTVVLSTLPKDITLRHPVIVIENVEVGEINVQKNDNVIEILSEQRFEADVTRIIFRGWPQDLGDMTEEQMFKYIIKKNMFIPHTLGDFNLSTLNSGEVSENVIDAYFKLLNSKIFNSSLSIRKTTPIVFVTSALLGKFQTQVYDYHGVKKWGSKAGIQIGSTEKIVFAVNIKSQHWTLAVVYPLTTPVRIEYYDSYLKDNKSQYFFDHPNNPESSHDYLKSCLCNYVKDEIWTRWATNLRIDNAEFHVITNLPNQGETMDCGVYLMVTASRLLNGDVITSQPFDVMKTRYKLGVLLAEDSVGMGAPSSDTMIEWAEGNVAIRRVAKTLNEDGTEKPIHFYELTGEAGNDDEYYTDAVTGEDESTYDRSVLIETDYDKSFIDNEVLQVVLPKVLTEEDDNIPDVEEDTEVIHKKKKQTPVQTTPRKKKSYMRFRRHHPTETGQMSKRHRPAV